MEFKKIFIDGIETSYSVYENGTVKNDLTGKFLKGTKGKFHWIFQLTLKDRKANFTIDFLMQNLLPPRPYENSILMHKDGNPFNSHRNNLYWYTPQIDDSWKKIYIDGEETQFYVNKIGEVMNGKTGKLLKGDTKKSYHYFCLRFNGKQKTKSGHRLVAEAFIPNPNNLPYVHHKDHNRLNNKVENLQWVTETENSLDMLPIKKQESFYSLTYNSLPNEIWANYRDTHYEVSNLGRVRNLKTMKVLKGSLRDDGYVKHCINNKNILTHILVIESFVKILEKGEEVNHINCNKTDNRLENLEIVSHQENMRKAAENGKCGVKRVGRFDFEGNLLQIYPSAAAAARDVGINPSSMRNLINYYNGKRGKETFKYLDEGSSTIRDNNPEAQNA